MTDPYYQRDGITIYHGDCREIAPQLSGATAIVSDPPYGLSFMGKDWDHGVPGQHFWELISEACLPGAMLLAFGGTRTYHRLVCAIEDAGFEIRDCIQWIYGSGFPKSLDISKAIDKRGGYPHLAKEIGEALKSARESRGWSATKADQTFCGGTTNWSWFEGRLNGQRAPTVETFSKIAAEWPELEFLAEKVAEAEREVVGQDTKARSTSGKSALPTVGGETVYESWDITTPSTEHAKTWNGYGTALKPAHEPICVAMKPLSGTYAQNAIEHGVAGINVDGCRVGIDLETEPDTGSAFYAKRETKYPTENSDGSGGSGASFSVQAHDRSLQSNGRWPANIIHDGSDEVVRLFPETTGSKPIERPEGFERFNGTDYANGEKYNSPAYTSPGYEDKGSAARFFYCAKESDREIQPEEDFPLWGEAFDSVKNTHPTVKPLALMTYLIKLVTMPERNLILDPFMGSGTTLVAAKMEGRQAIGIEIEEKYCEIAANRLAQGVLNFD